MDDDRIDEGHGGASNCEACEGLSRRDFAAASVAATGLFAAGGAYAAAAGIRETAVTIKTPDGNCDAVLVHPDKKGSWPAVIVWPDIFGLRPVMVQMASRLAGEGYTVLVVNPFYRSIKARGPGEPEIQMAQTADWRKLMTPEGIMRDAVAFTGWLDKQASVKRRAKIGTVGYCMGGPLTMQTAAAVPNRIGAAVSFHGAGLVTAGPDSPHLLVPKIKAISYFGVAKNDDARAPDDKVKLKAAYDAAKLDSTVLVYPANHGWTVPGGNVYDATAAETAYANMVSLYQKALV